MDKKLFEQIKKLNLPESVALILDGNGRWAKKRGLPRTAGHAEGIKRIGDILDLSYDLGIKHLLMYAFSTENWNRPDAEVNFLMNAFVEYMSKYVNKLIEKQVKVKIIGEKNKLSEKIIKLIEEIEDKTKSFDKMTFYLCFNYGSRLEITHAVKEICQETIDGKLDINDITPEVIGNHLYTSPLENVDFLIRTSGEERLSNFLLWQMCYSEFYFTDTYWPDFKEDQYLLALEEYCNRNRRFGGIK